jgi:4-hydroxybenzoate polyprenyltransferase
MLLPLLKSLRPHQWIKNAFVLAPLVFGHKLTDPALLVRGLAAALIFSLLSGSVYLLNDLADIDKDRAHPLKRHRPIPSGALPEPVARNASRIIAFAALTGAASLDLRFGLVAGLYWLLNVAYSRGLKHTAFVDVGIIALGFLFRILAGGYAINVPVSVWLAGCTFLLALYLGLGKRLHELITAGEEGAKQRDSLKRYSEAGTKRVMAIVALCTVAAYAGYCFSPATAAMFRTELLPWTIPSCIIGVARFYELATREDRLASPTEQIVRDLPFVANFALWSSLFLWMIYR